MLGMTAWVPDAASLRRRLSGIVALVGNEPGAQRHGGQQGRSGRDVGDVSGSQNKHIGAALGVGQGMDLGRAAATRSPDGLNFRPPFPPAAERWAFTWVESMARSSGISAAATTVAKMRCQTKCRAGSSG